MSVPTTTTYRNDLKPLSFCMWTNAVLAQTFTLASIGGAYNAIGSAHNGT